MLAGSLFLRIANRNPVGPEPSFILLGGFGSESSCLNPSIETGF